MALYRLVTNTGGGECTHAVVALTPGGAIGQRLREAGIELVTFDFKASPISNFFDLLTLIRKNRPDIVQTWMYHADMLGGLAARLVGNRNVIWGVRVAEVKAGDSRATAVIRQICAWLSGWVPHTIVCVAEAARRTHIAAGYDATRMVVVPNGFDLSRLVVTEDQRAALRTQCGFRADDLVVGTLGRFNFNKDQQNFVRACALLADQNDKVRFLMVGRDLETANAELMSWIDKTGRADRFVLLGERADAPVCLAVMDIFCLSSRIEGFPNAVGEAMAMGLPCVVTDVGDAAMLVADTGVVVPKEDSDALAKGLADLVAMGPTLRAQMGQMAKARIVMEFAAERARQRFEALYKKIIEERER